MDVYEWFSIGKVVGEHGPPVESYKAVVASGGNWNLELAVSPKAAVTLPIRSVLYAFLKKNLMKKWMW